MERSTICPVKTEQKEAPWMTNCWREVVVSVQGYMILLDMVFQVDLVLMYSAFMQCNVQEGVKTLNLPLHNKNSNS